MTSSTGFKAKKQGRDNRPIKVTDPSNVSKEVAELIERMNDDIEKRNGKPYKWSYDDFDIGFPLGKGKFGRVYLAKERRTDTLVALKLMHKSEIRQANIEVQVRREIEIHSHLKHPHILEMYTYFDDERFLYIVLEYAAGGELYSYMRNKPLKRFDSEESAKFLSQLVSALQYCHCKKVMHRDIKPENILLDSPGGNIKLSDFGWSVHAPSSNRRTMCGTLDYLPPEIVLHQKYDHHIDHWCLGVLLYEFLVGVPPFESESTNETYKRITSVDFIMPSHVPPLAAQLINKLLQKDPNDRIELDEILVHEFIKTNYTT